MRARIEIKEIKRMDEIKTLCIISCGKTKIWDKYPNIGPVKAKRVYTGWITIKYIEYAKLIYPSSWIILSAKYGFLYPNDVIFDTYDIRIDDKESININKLHNQIIDKELHNYDKIVILGSKMYSDVVISLFPDKDISAPLVGLKVGDIRHTIKELIKKEELKYTQVLDEWF